MEGDGCDDGCADGVVDGTDESVFVEREFVFEGGGADVDVHDALMDVAAGGVAVDSRADYFGPQVCGALFVVALFHSVGTQIVLDYVVEQLGFGALHGRMISGRGG